MKSLYDIAAKMVAPGKGILAADESVASAGKRLAAVGVDSTEETRRQYRNLFLAAEGVENYLSGVILHDETMRQKADDGTPFPALLEKNGILPGIKVDAGSVPLPGFPDEEVTEGLDGLARRLKDYRGMGARFAKWRAVIRIGKGIPTREALESNAYVLARYARLCQDADIVPMVEPEVLLDGAHGMKTSYRVTKETLRTVFEFLKTYRADLRAVILKTSMVVPGSESGEKMDSSEVGRFTAKCLRAAVPKEVPGVVFLSGGQTALEATANLNEIARRGPYPWGVTFSYARALQGPPLEVWRGDASKAGEARKIFLKRLEMNALAREGKWTDEKEA